MKKLLAALLALLCLPVMTALGDTQGDFTYALTPEGAVVTMYYVEDAAQTPAVITVPDVLGGQPVVGIGENAFPADCEVICLHPDTQILPPDAETQD